MAGAGGSPSARRTGRLLSQTGRDVGVHVLALAEGESPVGSFYLESELLVESYGGRIVHVHAEIQPPKIKPVVCEIQTGFHKRGADALPLPVIPYRYPKCPACCVLGFM